MAMKCGEFSEEIADEFLANKMKIDKETAIIRISRVCTADGKPAIYCDDFFRKEYYQTRL